MVIKSRRRRWTGHVARIGEKCSAYKVVVRKPERKKRLGRARRRGMILKYILKNRLEEPGLDSSGLR
jgi:hypothetical protein